MQKILKGVFVDMHELLPEMWLVEEPSDSCCRATQPKRGLVTDIALWTKCFASLVAVLTTKYPDRAPQFMWYLCTIVRASRNFEGAAWASYDAAYRRQAANRDSFDSATIDPTIYNEAFTCRAKLMPRCLYCLADTHEACECQYAPRDEPTPAKHSRTTGGLSRRQVERANTRLVDICELFNQQGGNRCTFKWCRYAHICSKCRYGQHPASECGRPLRGPVQSDTPRAQTGTTSPPRRD